MIGLQKYGTNMANCVYKYVSWILLENLQWKLKKILVFKIVITPNNIKNWRNVVLPSDVKKMSCKSCPIFQHENVWRKKLFHREKNLTQKLSYAVKYQTKLSKHTDRDQQGEGCRIKTHTQVRGRCRKVEFFLKFSGWEMLGLYIKACRM